METNDIEILLVEDHPDDVELTLQAFRRSKLANRVHVARDGEEALDFLYCRGIHAGRRLDRPPRVMLLDLKLPKIDGLEVLRIVKADPVLRMIPVVVMTSSSEQRDLVEGYRLGVNSYIQKPVSFDRFQEIVAQLGFYWLVVNEPVPRTAYEQSRSAGPCSGEPPMPQ
ncbi:two-component system response regulator [Opitutaceae bacterium EW11]|nr:two-component system response regulator [Opitutaceae bacterium EW11]